MELADEEREQGGSVGQGVGVDVFVSSMGVGADVAQAAANAGVQAARAYTSTAQAGRDDATTILDQLAGTVLTGTHVDARRDSTTATVTVTGQAVAVLPGLHLPVRASVTAPRERVPGIP